MAETLSTLSILSFIVAAICLVFAIFFWFFFRIPTVIGDLSGSTARKSIAKMRQSNEKSGNKGYRASKVNMERGKITNAIEDDVKIYDGLKNEERPDTGLLKENRADKIILETTDLLDKEIESEETQLLKEGIDTKDQPYVKQNGIKLTIIDEVILIHTTEVIE